MPGSGRRLPSSLARTVRGPGGSRGRRRRDSTVATGVAATPRSHRRRRAPVARPEGLLCSQEALAGFLSHDGFGHVRPLKASPSGGLRPALTGLAWVAAGLASTLGAALLVQRPLVGMAPIVAAPRFEAVCRSPVSRSRPRGGRPRSARSRWLTIGTSGSASGGSADRRRGLGRRLGARKHPRSTGRYRSCVAWWFAGSL